MKRKSPKSLRVYLWYSDRDRHVAQRIYDFLSSKGVFVWSKENNILPGQVVQDAIAEAIKISDAIILCFSQNSAVEQGPLQTELKSILAKKSEMPDGVIHFIPIRLNECNTPTGFKELKQIDFFPKKDEDRTLNLILKVLDHLARLAKRDQPRDIWGYLHSDEWANLISYHLVGDFEKFSYMSPFLDLKNSIDERSVNLSVYSSLDANKKIIILVGDAGTGKTLSLLRTAYRFASGHSLEEVKQKGLTSIINFKIPLYFEFRSISTFESSEVIDRFCLGEVEKRIGGRKLSSLQDLLTIPGTHWILFLDGFDEIRKRDNAVPELKRWLALLPNNVQCVMTSRPYCVNEIHGDAHVTVAPLQKNEIRQLLIDKLKKSERVNNKVVGEIISILDNNPDLYDILWRSRAIDGFAKYFGYDPEQTARDFDVVEVVAKENNVQDRFGNRRNSIIQKNIPKIQGKLFLSDFNPEVVYPRRTQPNLQGDLTSFGEYYNTSSLSHLKT